MEIIKKISQKNNDIYSRRPACIAFLGDSVTQGCFELYQTSSTSLETIFDQSSAYHEYLKQRLAEMFPSSPVVIVNAGISGDNAKQALGRLDRDVLSFKPDLVVVCFGLNDCSSGEKGVETFRNSMQRIVQSVKDAGAEVIVMTPCDMADHVSVHVENETFRYPFVTKCIKDAVALTNNGGLKAYVKVLREVAKQMNVPLCDVYARWQKLKELGMNTTEFLANKVNHPTREANKIFSDLLLYTMIDN